MILKLTIEVKLDDNDAFCKEHKNRMRQFWKEQYDWCIDNLKKCEIAHRASFVKEANYAASKLKELSVIVPAVS